MLLLRMLLCDHVLYLALRHVLWLFNLISNKYKNSWLINFDATELGLPPFNQRRHQCQPAVVAVS